MLHRIWFFIIMITLPLMAHAKPNQVVPQIEDVAKKYYDIDTHQFDDHPNYKIFVAIPKRITPESRVIYLLDGNGQFPLFVNQITQKEGNNYPILIGLGYQSDNAYPTELRTKDYTPQVNGDAFSKGGGFVSFYQFIKTELKPWVNNTYQLANHQDLLFGHSFGGLFTLMVYQQDPLQFDNYVSASPSLWWGEGSMIDLTKLKSSATLRNIVFTTGELEQQSAQSKTNEVQKQFELKKRSWITLKQLYDEVSAENTTINYYIFAGKSHGSSIPSAIDIAVKTAGYQ